MSEATMTEQIVDVEGEEVSSAAVQRHEPTTPAAAPSGGAALGLFGTVDPVDVVAKARVVASALMEVVEEQKLYLEKRDGRRYLNVEAWTLLGSMLQVRAIPQPTQKEPDHEGNWHPPKYHEETKVEHSKWCKQGPRNQKGETNHPYREGECDTYEKQILVLDEPGAGGFTCRVEAIDATGHVVGASSSRCMWEEAKWRDRDAYAVESMAQTRGISKALSGPLRFIVELAGFKGTPAEEIPDDEWSSSESESVPAGADADLRCPSCGSPVYDNTGDEEKMEKRWPAYKCTNRSCSGGEDGKQWATWERHFFDEKPDRELSPDEIDRKRNNKVKELLVVNVKKHNDATGAWDTYYNPSDPANADDVDEIGLAVSNDDDGRRAALLWRDLLKVAGVDQPSDELTRRRILKAADTLLDRVGEHGADVCTIEEAWTDACDTFKADSDVEETKSDDGYRGSEYESSPYA